MRTKKYNTIEKVSTKYNFDMEVGSYFTEYECELTGFKLIEEKPVGLMRIVGIKRSIVLSTGETEEITEGVFEIFKKLIR